ncbi:hypothetical protein [Sphingomonas sp. H160509]|uniref:hypothetical protein n=1 Tax=Sphingomonas sp. H160509 TaxID=2955313 RepID=UPI00406CA2EC
MSLIDADRQWFKAKAGVEVDQTSLDTSVCALAIQQRDVFQIEDLSKDSRTAGMSLVRDKPGIRFYAGAPLVTRAGVCPWQSVRHRYYRSPGRPRPHADRSLIASSRAGGRPDRDQ